MGENSAINLYQQLAIALSQGPIVLATVIQTQGSTPREVGAKMLVYPNGKMIGTIGGGAAEAKVYDRALELFSTNQNSIVEIDLSGALHRDVQGVCGGMMKIFLQRWDTSHLSIANQIVSALENRINSSIVTPFTIEQIPYLQFNSSNSIQLTETAFIEPLRSQPTLLIIGAGHVGVALAQAAHFAGFEVIVTDDRSNFATIDRFPTAAQILALPIEDAIAKLPAVSDLYIALVNRGFQQDLSALKATLDRSTRYIGMIGSQKRIRHVFETLIQEGISAIALDQIHAPIGLDIGALTPEEIAISIVAELIKVRRAN